MKLLVISHKPCWKSENSPIGYATDGGFVYHMQGWSSFFDETTIIVPVYTNKSAVGEVPFRDKTIKIIPVKSKYTLGVKRKLEVVSQLPGLIRTIKAEMKKADVIHMPVPGDYGSLAIYLSHSINKPVFIRHCADFANPKSAVQRKLKAYMEKNAGGQKIMMATGGAVHPPSELNKNISWIFSTSLVQNELKEMGVKKSINGKKSFNLITVSRQSKTKGTAKVIGALKNLIANGYDVHLNVVGDGEHLSFFKNIAEQEGVKDKIIFHGKLDSQGVYSQLKKSDLFVYPTRASEGFPKVVLEALAHGLPVITNPISVLPQLIGETGAGIVLKNDNNQDIVEAIQGLLDNPKDYQNCSESAIETASQFSLEKWGQKMISSIEENTSLTIPRKHPVVKI